MTDVPDLLAALQRSVDEARANRAAAEIRAGVGTGAGEGAPRQDTGSAWVTRSEDYPEAPAQAHSRPVPIDPATRVLDALGREWAMQTNGGWGAIGSTATADSFAEIDAKYGPVEVLG